MLWLGPDHEDMYVYCNGCSNLEPKGPRSDDVDEW